jgi:hypothetical protein
MRVFRPPFQLVTNDRDPVIFLAGPIQGAPDWQSEAIAYVAESASDVVVCDWHGHYETQVDWELLHLEAAARTGVIMFWLARQEEPKTEPGSWEMIRPWKPPRAYAQTSRLELGEWVGRWHQGRDEYGRELVQRPVVGIEPGFTNERYIRQRLDRLGFGEVHSDLERTTWAALDAVVRRRDK